jgi:UDP-N-acetylglucosamine--N-acetylmuramyl-(pentapeptide) pyrophosphoryl-undecaprenol N-acetylglucosamine transferase
MEKQQTLCFVAGRSGGHLIPALTLAQQKKQKNTALKVLFFSSHRALDRHIVGSCEAVDYYVPLKLNNVPLRKPWLLPIFGWHFCVAFFSARKHLRRYRPISVLSTGGYVSIPVFLAARSLRIPVELFELNVIPGKAAHFLARYAQTIYVCFEQTKKYFAPYTCQLTPYPIRLKPFDNAEESRQQALHQFHLSPQLKTILILGGSQGSVFLNNATKTLLNHHPELAKTLQIIHQTGALDNDGWNAFYKQKNITAFVTDFSEHVRMFYAAADLVICRSGAGSLFETLFFKKPCITIPLETTENNHQLDNAVAMQESYPHLFSVMRQNDITKNTEVFAREIEKKLKISNQGKKYD